MTTTTDVIVSPEADAAYRRLVQSVLTLAACMPWVPLEGAFSDVRRVAVEESDAA